MTHLLVCGALQVPSEFRRPGEAACSSSQHERFLGLDEIFPASGARRRERAIIDGMTFSCAGLAKRTSRLTALCGAGIGEAFDSSVAFRRAIRTATRQARSKPARPLPVASAVCPLSGEKVAPTNSCAIPLRFRTCSFETSAGVRRQTQR